jgi:hypothetical protein
MSAAHWGVLLRYEGPDPGADIRAFLTLPFSETQQLLKSLSREQLQQLPRQLDEYRKRRNER